MKLFQQPRWMLLLILLATTALFVVLLPAPPLTWDDDSNIFSNPYFHAGLWQTFWLEPYFGLYIPLTSTVWEILFHVGAGAAWPFRLLNLLLHLLNIALAFQLLRCLAERWRLQSPWPVILGVCAFAFHPLQVEAVAWISGGRDLLSTTFALLALWFYFRGWGWRLYALSTLFFVCAVLSKPNAVILPVVMVALELVLRPEFWRRACVRMLPWLALTIWPMWLTLTAQVDHMVHVDALFRPWIMLDTYGFYLRKLLWPYPLSGNYARTPEYVLARPYTLGIGLIFGLGLVLSLLWSWWRDRRFLIGVTWMLLLLPVSGVVSFGYQRISNVADHYHYAPMLVVSAVLMLLLEHMAVLRRSAGVVTGVLAVLMFAVACTRVDVWSSDRHFFTDMQRTAPESYSTAIGLSIVACLDDQDFEAGVQWTERALLARPGDILALANQAYCFLHAKNYFRVTELEFYLNRLNLEELAALRPTAYSSLLASIGTAEIELHDYDIGYQYLCEAYRVKPSEPNHARNLQVATQILHDAGVTPQCDEGFDPAPGDPYDDGEGPGEDF
jgi:hypothetical protein